MQSSCIRDVIDLWEIWHRSRVSVHEKAIFHRSLEEDNAIKLCIGPTRGVKQDVGDCMESAWQNIGEQRFGRMTYTTSVMIERTTCDYGPCTRKGR